MEQQWQRSRRVLVASEGHKLPQDDAEYLAIRRDYERQGFVVRLQNLESSRFLVSRLAGFTGLTARPAVRAR